MFAGTVARAGADFSFKGFERAGAGKGLHGCFSTAHTNAAQFLGDKKLGEAQNPALCRPSSESAGQLSSGGFEGQNEEAARFGAFYCGFVVRQRGGGGGLGGFGIAAAVVFGA